MELLNDITMLSHEFGTESYVKGGGGNTSAKDAETLWVKPSGTTLGGLSPQTFVGMSRARLGELYNLTVPAESAAREALVQEAMAAAVLPGQSRRPSVEAPLHDSLAARFVVHTHPAAVNGMTCARQGKEVCARLFPEALWVPYIDPGYTLCMNVRLRVQEYTQREGKSPSLLVLENHGIFVAADEPDAVRALYARVMSTLKREYARAGIPLTLTSATPAPEAEAAQGIQHLQRLLGHDAAAVAYGGRFVVAHEPISPDHIVYAKSYPCVGEPSHEGIDAFRARHGYTPLVYDTPVGVFAIGPNERKAGLTLELAKDGALIIQLADAFGGIQFLSDRAREFIEHWEVESYRQKQLG